MEALTITYYGHSCFKVSFQGKCVLFDPYQDDSVPGLRLPRDITVDACYCSHGHADHNASNLVKVTGTSHPFPVSRMEVPHDDVRGAKRGLCQVTLITCGNATIAHLGDYGRLPTEAEYAVLRRAQILLVPCGGYFTIDARQAKEVIADSGAPLAILMHFRKGRRGYDVLSDIADIRKVFGRLDERQDTTLTLDPDHIPTGVMTLEPEQ